MRVALGASLALAVVVVAAADAGAAAAVQPRPALTGVAPSAGPAGTTVSALYEWDYRHCASAAADPSALLIQLRWDGSSASIGSAVVTVSSVANLCGGTVTGSVPANATDGPHRLNAYLVDPGAGGARVPRSAAFGALFTVGPLPTAVPAPTPFALPPLPGGVALPSSTAVVPSPTITPLPSPSFTPASTDAPTASGAPSSATGIPPPGSGIAPAVSGGGGAPPGGWVLDLSVITLLLAAATIAAVAAVRSRRSGSPDPFEFVR